ncbi:hypothetical protein DFH27DRAFT_520974 [Peziza echinospora]|nr:hypothetical protein DFH27DRAFT_520974 [Peziza echinospora]
MINRSAEPSALQGIESCLQEGYYTTLGALLYVFPLTLSVNLRYQLPEDWKVWELERGNQMPACAACTRAGGRRYEYSSMMNPLHFTPSAQFNGGSCYQAGTRGAYSHVRLGFMRTYIICTTYITPPSIRYNTIRYNRFTRSLVGYIVWRYSIVASAGFTSEWIRVTEALGRVSDGGSGSGSAARGERGEKGREGRLVQGPLDLDFELARIDRYPGFHDPEGGLGEWQDVDTMQVRYHLEDISGGTLETNSVLEGCSALRHEVCTLDSYVGIDIDNDIVIVIDNDM